MSSLEDRSQHWDTRLNECVERFHQELADVGSREMDAAVCRLGIADEYEELLKMRDRFNVLVSGIASKLKCEACLDGISDRIAEEGFENTPDLKRRRQALLNARDLLYSAKDEGELQDAGKAILALSA